MSSWHSYPKINALGHREVSGILDGPVTVEEKIDGSQFSFGMHDGVLKMRSKGREFEPSAADDMFCAGAESVIAKQHLLTPGWTYRGEYLRKAKHNVLAYERAPAGHVMIYDIETGLSAFADRATKETEAARIGFDCVPLYFEGVVGSVDELAAMLERVSVLGGQKIEGVVIKNYARFTGDGKVMMAKIVSADFKEVHAREWKKENPGGKDILGMLGEKYRSEARWNKAIQRMREAGTLQGTPADIGALIKSVQADIDEECRAEIAEQLAKWAWPHVARKSIAGLPEWYKQRLAAGAVSD